MTDEMSDEHSVLVISTVKTDKFKQTLTCALRAERLIAVIGMQMNASFVHLSLC